MTVISPAISARASFTVLNINDEDAIRYVLTRIMRAGGLNVVEAVNGKRGLELAASLPHLILLDVQLPDINGLEVCKSIKADPATGAIPILMISANFVRPADKEAGLQSGAADYLTHPIAPADLLAAIDSLLPSQDGAER